VNKLDTGMLMVGVAFTLLLVVRHPDSVLLEIALILIAAGIATRGLYLGKKWFDERDQAARAHIKSADRRVQTSTMNHPMIPPTANINSIRLDPKPPKVTDQALINGWIAMSAMAVGLIAGAFYYGLDHGLIIGMMGIIYCVGWLAQRFVCWARPDLEYSPLVYGPLAAQAGVPPWIVKNSLAINGVLLLIMALGFDDIVAALAASGG
jgi:hypothetical protein